MYALLKCTCEYVDGSLCFNQLIAWRCTGIDSASYSSFLCCPVLQQYDRTAGVRGIADRYGRVWLVSVTDGAHIKARPFISTTTSPTTMPPPAARSFATRRNDISTEMYTAQDDFVISQGCDLVWDSCICVASRHLQPFYFAFALHY
jgi:hypothetical protein